MFLRKNEVYCCTQIILIIMLALLPATPVDAQQKQRTEYSKKSRKVVKSYGRYGGVIQCSLVTTYRVVVNSQWVCTNNRLGGACLTPGIRRHPNYSSIKKSCPRICNSGYWKDRRSRPQVISELLQDCTGARIAQ